jgi:hypothetical protein
MALGSARSISDYRTPEGRPDVRGWPVVAEGDTRVGTVQDLLVDKDTRELRYLEVDLDDRDDTVLVPVGHARADQERNRIVLPGLQRDSMTDIPGWGGRVEDLDEDRERRIGEGWDERYGNMHYYHRPEFRSDRDRDEQHDDDRTPREGTGTLGRLDELDDYKVADRDPDPRGWTVVDPTGAEIGTVDHLIGDTGIMKVRYFVVDLDEGTPAGQHHILVPAGFVTLDEDDEEVMLEGLLSTGLAGIPRYEQGALAREHEDQVTRAWQGALAGESRYRHPRYRETSFWGEGSTSTRGR